MKNLMLSTDLSIATKHHQILVKSSRGEVKVNIIGKSVLHIPFRLVKSLYKHKRTFSCVDQAIIISENNQSILEIKHGKIAIKNYLLSIKYLLKSISG